MSINSIPHPTDASIILTYRCPMRCKMCNVWQYPTEKSKEIQPEDLRTLPKLKFINLTGGEPFIREDLDKIVEECYKHTERIVISTSGWFEDRVVALAKKFPNIGIRISIEGLSCKNDELRGHAGGFDKGLHTLLTLKDMGLKDIGFGCTVSNNNSKDMLSLYQLSKSLGMEFATAAFHNSYYFHKDDNVITNKDEVCKNFEQLIEWQLKENHPKSWFRAFFNMGLINYIEGGRRMLPCEAGSANFFIEPYGDVYPCNGLEEKYWMKKMGNIRETPNFMTIWESEQAQQVRAMVRKCPKNCWMVGTASPVMHKYIKHPLKWALKNKFLSIKGKPACLDKCWYNVGQDPCQGDLRDKFNKQRYDSLDGLRAYAAVGIVLMHVLSNITLKPSENYLTLKLIPFFTDFTLLFMIVSGFSLCCGYYERFKKGTITPNSFYKKRYARILPYFACLCLLDLVMNPSRGAFFETFANLTLCFNLLPNPHITVIGVGWFLGVVFVFYLLFPFFVFMTDNKRRAWLSMLIALGFVWVAMLYFYTPEFVDKSPGRTNFIYCAPLFLSGGIAYLYRKSICQ